MSHLELGARVKYRAAFCRSIGAYAGPIPWARGEVIAEVETDARLSLLYGIVRVRWDNGLGLPDRVNERNLIGEHVMESN